MAPRRRVSRLSRVRRERALGVCVFLLGSCAAGLWPLLRLSALRPLEPQLSTHQLDQRVDLAKASAGELALLPAVGPSLAQRLVDARAAGQRLSTPSDLLAVRGVGPRTLERLSPHVRWPDSAGEADAPR